MVFESAGRLVAIPLLVLGACASPLLQEPAPEPVPGLRVMAAEPEPAPEIEPPPLHPLDPLSAMEIDIVTGTLREAGRIDEDSRFPFVALREPEKAKVLAWRPGLDFSRHALAVVRDRGEVYEAIVDVRNRHVDSWEKVEDVQASLLLEEILGVGEIVRADAGWQEAMRARGFESFDAVACMPLSAGFFDVPEEEGRRLVRVPCFDGRRARNVWGRPIEGLLAVVDLDERDVVKLVDTGALPVPDSQVDYDREAVGPPRPVPAPITKSQASPGFDLRGRDVAWQRWRFHVRLEARAGLVLSLVEYDDAGTMRPILYQANVAELFVPYMDPDPLWYFRSYLDMGEYGLGKLTSVLVEGVDCPANAVYLGDVLADDRGNPVRREKVACLFEREPGDVAWRHYDFVTDTNESRSGRELVVRSVATIGNYDYVFDWIFRQDGTIRVSVGATGIAEAKVVEPRDATAPGGEEAMAHGRFVADHLVAVNHDHFMSFRLDFDVDGPENSLVVSEIRTEKSPKGPRKSLWRVHQRVAKRESDAKLHGSMTTPALWRVVNPSASRVGGSPTSFEIHPGHNAMAMLSKEDFPQKRAGFTDYTLWATPYEPDERFAAGDYPNQSPGGDGLPKWTKADRPVEATDIVLWYTLGFHHVVRAEDWPVMPTSTHGFELRPFDFFRRNPAIDLP